MIDKGAGQIMQVSQVGSEKSSESKRDRPLCHYGSAPGHRRPEAVDRVGDYISSRGDKVHGVGEAHGKYP